MDKKSPLGKNKWQYSAKMSRYTNCFSKLILYFATLSNSNTDTTNNLYRKA